MKIIPADKILTSDIVMRQSGNLCSIECGTSCLSIGLRVKVKKMAIKLAKKTGGRLLNQKVSGVFVLCDLD